MWFPILLLAAGVGAIVIVATTVTRDEPPVHDPDLPPTPGSTGYKLVDAILGELKKAAAAAGVPLGLLVGWIAKESGGKIAVHPQPGPGDTKYDERGYFQLMPAESKTLGLDHERLSVDQTYSINGGLAAIGLYMGVIDRLGVAPKGTSYYWRLVKLAHSMGEGAVKKILEAAQSAGAANSWASLKSWALAHDAELLKIAKHSPAKWFPFIDKVYDVGAPFGFGSTEAIVGAMGPVPGGKIFTDIPDPLDCLKV